MPRIFSFSYPEYLFIPSYSGYLYPRTPDIYTLVPRIFIPSYPGYPYPRTPDIHTLVPRIFIPSYPGYNRRLYVRTGGFWEIYGLGFSPRWYWGTIAAGRYYENTKPVTLMSLTLSLTSLLWRHQLRYYDVTNFATMMSLTSLLWRHHLCYYDVTNLATMMSLTSLLWRH